MTGADIGFKLIKIKTNHFVLLKKLKYTESAQQLWDS